MSARECAWCRGPIPATARRDAVTCSKRCRQARNRFALTVGGAGVSSPLDPMRFAYADPPYPGNSKRYYGEHCDYAGEVDHVELIARLVRDYDGWALSTSASALREVWALCPPGAKLAPWVRGARAHREPVVVNSWEPVIYFGARHVVPDAAVDASHPAAAAHDASSGTVVGRGAPGGRDASVVLAGDRDASQSAGATRRIDSLVLGVTAMTTNPHRVVGAKPAGFSRWLFDLLGVRPTDTFDDLFPGSGAVGRAWDVYRERAA